MSININHNQNAITLQNRNTGSLEDTLLNFNWDGAIRMPAGNTSARPKLNGTDSHKGYMRYNLSDNVYEYYNGTEWTSFGGDISITSGNSDIEVTVANDGSITITYVGGASGGLSQGAVDTRIQAGVADWAETGNTDTIPDAKIPSGIARDTEIPDVTSFLNQSEVDARITNQVTKPFIDGLNVDADTLDGNDSTHYLDYRNLTNTPTPFSGSYTDLSNQPTLFSGDYNDLTNRPTIPTIPPAITEEQVDDWVSNLLVAGDNITLTYDDAANTITIASTGGTGTALDDIDLMAGTGINLLPSPDGESLEISTDGIALQAGTGIRLSQSGNNLIISSTATGGSGGTAGVGIIVSDTVPASPTVGDLWLNSTNARLYYYYRDPDSSQWVGLSAGTTAEMLTILATRVTANPSGMDGDNLTRITIAGINYNLPYLTESDVDTRISNQVTTSFVNALNVDADRLDGQAGPYYSNYNNLSNKPNIPSVTALTQAAYDALVTKDGSTLYLITDAM